MTRLGFVGVGKHAKRIAAAFRECGAEIVAHDRRQGFASSLAANMARADPDGFCKRVPWSDMITSPDIDAIVCCAPPAVTADVALECERAHKRLMATKPLLLTGDGGLAPLAEHIYVDLWRLYSPAWLALKADLRGREIRSVHVDFYGNGPVRMTHSGLLDYGPHALAFVLNLGLKPELMWAVGTASTHIGEQWTGGTKDGSVSVSTGNGFGEPRTWVSIKTTDGGQYVWHERDQVQVYDAGGMTLLKNWRDLALRDFCRAFLAGEPSDTLRVSCEAMKLLRQAEPW